MRKIILTFVSLLFVVISASADVIDDWHRDQAAIEAMLQQKQYADARKAAIKLTKRMFDRLGTDEASNKVLAQTVALRAAAEDGLGNVDDTNWYRQVAKALDPQVLLPPMATPNPEPIDARDFKALRAASANVESPEAIHKRPPERPAIVNVLRDAIVILEVVVDVDGVTRQPRIIRSPAAAVSYAALESIKQWRFRPPKLDGKVVPMAFNMTVHFQ